MHCKGTQLVDIEVSESPPRPSGSGGGGGGGGSSREPSNDYFWETHSPPPTWFGAAQGCLL